jgi:hypothetical protein
MGKTVFVVDPCGVGVGVGVGGGGVKRRVRRVQDAGRLPTLENFRIQDKIQDNLDEIFGAACDDPLLSLVAYPRQTGNKTRTWWIPCRMPLRLPSCFCFQVSCAQVKVRLEVVWACRGLSLGLGPGE